jgi:hypothetical protein
LTLELPQTKGKLNKKRVQIIEIAASRLACIFYSMNIVAEWINILNQGTLLKNLCRCLDSCFNHKPLIELNFDSYQANLGSIALQEIRSRARCSLWEMGRQYIKCTFGRYPLHCYHQQKKANLIPNNHQHQSLYKKLHFQFHF